MMVVLFTAVSNVSDGCERSAEEGGITPTADTYVH